MKKVLVILAAAGLLFAMSSCSKDCKCKYYVDGDMRSEKTITRKIWKVWALKSART